MSGLAHFFEKEGLATIIVALVREHVEQMRPPRSLWVPFELGRPFGEPGNATQHSRVLLGALTLLDGSGPGPILKDFNDEKSMTDTTDNWQFPITLESDSVKSELLSLIPVWKQARRRHGRSTVGISGLSPEQAIEFIDRYHSAKPAPNPKGMSVVARARFAIDDIKALYLEAATAVGNPTSHQLQNWLWQQTIAGAMILKFQEKARTSENKNLQLIAGSLVPAERVISRC